MGSDIVNDRPAFKPVHPGEMLREDILPSLDISKAAFADHLHISRETLYAILNEKRGVSADIAVRLSRALDTTVEFWTNMQANLDAWMAARSEAIPAIAQLTEELRASMRPKRSVSTRTHRAVRGRAHVAA